MGEGGGASAGAWSVGSDARYLHNGIAEGGFLHGAEALEQFQGGAVGLYTVWPLVLGEGGVGEYGFQAGDEAVVDEGGEVSVQGRALLFHGEQVTGACNE